MSFDKLKLAELDAYAKIVTYDELMKMLAIIMAEVTKRAARRVLDAP